MAPKGLRNNKVDFVDNGEASTLLFAALNRNLQLQSTIYGDSAF